MMSMDRELLDEYMTHLAERFYGFEIIERLEDAGILTVQDVLAALEDFIIEGREHLED